jgi:DNA-binding response OmpR family regulator
VEGFRLAINNLPQLIIMNKEFPNLDGMGFLIKKRTSNKIENVPVFMMGDFTPEELVAFKRENVNAFITLPINPTVLKERIFNFFKLDLPLLRNTTPMLLDIHARGRIIIIQIEGNLESEKMEFNSYIVRSYCKKRQITNPKIFLIIPSLYPEGITNDNLDRLFRFTEYKELAIEAKNIKILCKNEKFVACVKNHDLFNNYQFVRDYIEGMQSLFIDFDRQKSIPIDFIKTGASYIFDLYNKSGKVVIPALTPANEEIRGKLKESGDTTLAYYSEVDFSEIETIEGELPALLSEDSELLNLVSGEYDAVELSYKYVDMFDEKHALYFRNMETRHVLLITTKEEVAEFIKDAFESYFTIHYAQDGNNISQLLQSNNFVLIFIDSEIDNPYALEILFNIRKFSTRRKTSVVILASKIDKVSVIRYRDAGTDNIVIAPFSTKKMLLKVFEALTNDRKS